MRKIALALAAAVLPMAPHTVSASVTYELSSSVSNFAYASPVSITTDTLVQATDLTSCYVSASTCQSVEFKPGASEDIIQIAYVDSSSMSGDLNFYFAPAAFVTEGLHPFAEGEGNLTVTGLSAVPLPAAGPMLGAALMLAGVIGRGISRRSSPADRSAA